MSKIAKDPLVSVIMGSKSDLDTMRLASEVLRELEIPHETKIISAHRTPDLMFEFAKNAKEMKKGNLSLILNLVIFSFFALLINVGSDIILTKNACKPCRW